MKNLTLKNDELYFNTQSYLHPAASSDTLFSYVEQPKPTQSSPNKQPSLDVSISEIQSLRANQRVNITATITMEDKDPKKVVLKATGDNSFVKEDCVIEDGTRSIMAHIWTPLIDNIKNGQAYLFKNLTVKKFQGCTFVSTSPHTTVSPTSQTLETLVGPNILENPDLQVTIPNLKFLTRLTVFTSCQVCKKRINDLSTSSIKCHHCGTRQRRSDTTQEASAKFCITYDDQDVWLNIFTPQLCELL